MKRLLLFTFVLCGMAVGASAQTIIKDLTSKINNADFTQDTPVANTIRTYDYDMEDNGAGSVDDEGNPGKGLYGMQPVTGWTANAPTTNTKVEERTDGTNARAAGVFAYLDENDENPQQFGLGGAYYAPFENDGITTTTNALGIVAVWGGSPIYSQEVTLEAGAYMLVTTLQNVSGSGTITNKIGFVTSGGTEYLSTKETYTTNEWITDTITFRLTSATTGNIQLGFSFGGGSDSAPHIFIDNVKFYQIDEAEMIQKEIDAAKEELAALVAIGKDYGANVSEAQAVINNPNATMEEVQAAIIRQQEINASAVTDLSPYFITNSHFDEDEPLVGGICTYDYDCERNNIPLTNYSMLPCTGWERQKTDNGCAAGVYAIGSGAFLGGADYKVPNTMSDGRTEGRVLGFVTCWGMAVQYKQPTTLQPGKYTLKLSYFNTGGTTAIEKNLIGFVADNGTEYLSEMLTFPVGKWTSDEITFTLSEETTGYFSLGYQSTGVGSGYMPHFFTDGFSLYYVGEIDPSMFALKGAVASGTKLLEEYFQGALKADFQAKVEAAQDLIDNESADNEANTAAAKAVMNMQTEVQASIDAYKKLKAFFDDGDFAKAYEKYEGTGLEATLNKMSDDISEQLDDEETATWTVKEIDNTIASLPKIIKDYVQQTFDNAVETGTSDGDIDISILYDNLGATYSTSALSNTAVVDKQWQYGDASNFKTQYGTMEVWNQSPFTVSQTMSNMPAGTYTLSVRAFYRTADQVSNYSQYIESPSDHAYVFAGSQKTALTNVAEIASPDAEAFASSVAVDDPATLYVPNSQQAAHNVFENPDYDEKLLKSAKTVLTSTGDLTFGITADEMADNAWVVWYTFELKYNPAIEENLVDSELEAIINETNAYNEENREDMSSPAADAMTEALNNAKEAKEGSTADKGKAIADLKQALADAEENVEAVANLTASIDKLNVAIEVFAATAPATLVEQAGELSGSDYTPMTTAEIKTLTDNITAMVSKLRIPDYSTTPCDFTVVIENNSFEGSGSGSLDGWEYYKGSDTQAADNSNGTYTIENADGYYVFNTWNGSAPEGGFYVSQTLRFLPAGKYVLTALLASDKGNKISLFADEKSQEFTMENEKGIAQEGSLTFNLKEEGDVVIKAQSGSWFKADKFQLTYYGPVTSDPEDVDGDGKVNITDVVKVINQIASGEYDEAFDVDGSGSINITDVVKIINKIAGTAN